MENNINNLGIDIPSFDDFQSTDIFYKKWGLNDIHTLPKKYLDEIEEYNIESDFFYFILYSQLKDSSKDIVNYMDFIITSIYGSDLDILEDSNLSIRKYAKNNTLLGSGHWYLTNSSDKIILLLPRNLDMTLFPRKTRTLQTMNISIEENNSLIKNVKEKRIIGNSQEAQPTIIENNFFKKMEGVLPNAEIY